MSFPLLCHSGSRYQVLLCIKPHEAVVLNSRERTPYMVYLEVMQLDCTCAAPNLSYLGGPDMEPQSLAGFPQTQDSPSSPPAAASGAAPAAAPPGPGDSGGRPASARGSTPPPRTLLAAAPSHTLLQTGAAFWPQEMVLEDARFLSYGESWAVRRERIRKQSPNGHLPGWDIKSCIVKAGDDIRQEVWMAHPASHCNIAALSLASLSQKRCTRGGGISGEKCVGEISPFRKAARFSPCESLVEQSHPSPPLQALCCLRRARREYARA